MQKHLNIEHEIPAFAGIKCIYFLGIGGIGMSALARYFSRLGKNVAGYDKTPSKLTRSLENEGIFIQFDENTESLGTGFSMPENTLVIYTPAVSPENKLFGYFKEKGFTMKKRSTVLGEITKGKNLMAVAGTHGKTTTTAILAHLLKASGVKITAFLGGVSENYHTNFLMDGVEAMVVEADEFDRSFLQLSPKMAAITSMDADHLDIYGEAEHLQNSFREFANLVEKENLFVKNGLPLEGKTFGLEDTSDFSVVNIKIKNGQYVFDLKTSEQTITGLKFNLPGRHNLLNAVAALAMAVSHGVKPEKLHSALESFKGVERRFSYRIKTNELVLIDDYAHHPTEINAVHQAVREMYPEKKVLVVFQPHLYSRTRDFADGFAESLGKFDEVLLLDIYPAREKPIAGVDSIMLLKKILGTQNFASPQSLRLIKKENISAEIKKSDCPVIVMMGAGDIGAEVEKVTESLKSGM
jgi:UDP-N-acetylmuramate--alanine ligase